jgi:hypothetical protein
MHASFRSCARSSSKAILGSLVMWVSLSLAQNTTVPAEAKKELPDAPMQVTSSSPSQNNLSFRLGAVPPRFDTNRLQGESWMGISPASERLTFNTQALASAKSKSDGKNITIAGRSVANRFTFEPIGGHASHPATHGGNEWYTNHIPWAGPIVRRGLKISKAHPHLTTVIKTIKPKL